MCVSCALQQHAHLWLCFKVGVGGGNRVAWALTHPQNYVAMVYRKQKLHFHPCCYEKSFNECLKVHLCFNGVSLHVFHVKK